MNVRDSLREVIKKSLLYLCRKNNNLFFVFKINHGLISIWSTFVFDNTKMSAYLRDWIKWSERKERKWNISLARDVIFCGDAAKWYCSFGAVIFYSPYNCAQRNITRRKPNKLRSNMTRRRRIELKKDLHCKSFFWSEWQGSNLRPQHPKCRALPTALHPDSIFLFLWFGSDKWSNTYSSELEPLVFSVFHAFPAFFAAFHSGKAAAVFSSQSKRATNCATPR